MDGSNATRSVSYWLPCHRHIISEATTVLKVRRSFFASSLQPGTFRGLPACRILQTDNLESGWRQVRAGWFSTTQIACHDCFTVGLERAFSPSLQEQLPALLCGRHTSEYGAGDHHPVTSPTPTVHQRMSDVVAVAGRPSSHRPSLSNRNRGSPAQRVNRGACAADMTCASPRVWLTTNIERVN